MQKLRTKTFRRTLSALIIVVSLFGLYSLKSPAVVDAAACQAPSTTYGTDTLSVTVATAGTYNVWVRMEAPATTSNSIMLQLDSGTCYNVGGSSSMTLNSWQWINYQNGSTSQTMQTTLSAGTHTLEFIGTEAGVGIDEALLLSDTSCVPTGTGTNCTPPLPITTPYYIQAGGPGFTDSQGNVWHADEYFTQDDTEGSTSGVTTGGDGSNCTTTLANENCTTQTITGTTNQQAFQYERWGAFHYDIPVNNGSYTVVLNFAEINPSGNGSTDRLFDVSIEGTQVLSSFNIAGQVGNYAADPQTFPVTVTNGDLNIAFTDVQNSAKLSSIEILPDSPPTVSLTAPTSGTPVSGTTVPLTAIASDPLGISNVKFTVDGTSVGQATTSPYTVNWNSTLVTDGTHTLVATATDTAGLTSTSSETITVANDVCSALPTIAGTLTDTDTSPLPANKVDLSWGAGTPGVNCSLSGYHIYRNGTLLTSVTSQSYSDTSVAAGSTYTYQVSAYESVGESAKIPSTPLSVTTGVNCSNGSGKPTAPTGLNESGNTYTGITLSWTASTLSDGCTLSGYHVYRNGVYLGDSSGTATTYSDSNLTSGTSYNYYVEAFDSGSNVSNASSTVSMSTKTDNVAPTVPTNLAGTSPNTTTVSLTWTASTDLPNPGAVGVKGYYIYRNDSTTPTYTIVGASTTSFIDTLVNPSTTYKYSVAAYDNNNNVSTASADISVTVSSPPPSCTANPTTPTNLAVTGQTISTLGLSWTASTPGTACTLGGYQIYRDGVYQTTVTGTTFSDSGLSPNTSYTYYVVAIDTSSHPSTDSSTVTGKTSADTTAPTTPTNVTATAVSPTSVQLSWTASTDNIGVTGYKVYRNNVLYATIGNVTSYLDINAVQNTTYTYQVTALDAALNESAKASTTPATVTTPTATVVDTTKPSAPGNVHLVISTSNSIDIAWDASTDNVGVEGYYVYRNGGSVPIATTGSTTYTDSGLTANTTYTYTVKAYDAALNVSDASSTLTTNTQVAPPAQTSSTSTPTGTSTSTTTTGSSSGSSSTTSGSKGSGKTTSSSSSAGSQSTGSTAITPYNSVNPIVVADDSTTEVTEPVTVQPATVQNQGIDRITYYLNNKLVYTTTSPSSPYHLDTTKLLNGHYTLLAKTTYTNGKVNTTTQQISVDNPLSLRQLWLIFTHYALIPLLVIVMIIFVISAIRAIRHFPHNPKGSAYKKQGDPTVVNPTVVSA